MRSRHMGMLPLAVAVSLVAPQAHGGATPANGTSSHPVTQSSMDGRDFIIRDVTIDAGGSTGWHWHDGTLTGAVKQGTLTHYAANCTVDGVYNAGDVVSEPAGQDHVHVGRNLGATPVILEVLYINPAGKPLAEDAANPGCPFA